MAQLPAQPVSFLLTLNGGFFCLLGTKIKILKKRDKADCIDCEAGQGGTADTDRLGPVSFNFFLSVRYRQETCIPELLTSHP